MRMTINEGLRNLSSMWLEDLGCKKKGTASYDARIEGEIKNCLAGKQLKLIPLGKGAYHVLLYTMEEHSTVMAHGGVLLRPGTFRISRWYLGFNPTKFKQTTTQVWIRIFNLPLEYRKEQNLLNVARGAGIPLKIDLKTLNPELGIYARVLVEVDFNNYILERILVKRRNPRTLAEEDFFVEVVYEKFLFFCTHFTVIGHEATSCRRLFENQAQPSLGIAALKHKGIIGMQNPSGVKHKPVEKEASLQQQDKRADSADIAKAREVDEGSAEFDPVEQLDEQQQIAQIQGSRTDDVAAASIAVVGSSQSIRLMVVAAQHPKITHNSTNN